MAIGQGSRAEGDYSTASGQAAKAKSRNATATGQNAWAGGVSSTATGQNSWANGENSTATGQLAKADGRNSTAIGAQAQAIDHNATALGVGAVAGNGMDANDPEQEGGENATAVGTYAGATGQGSIAIGTPGDTTDPDTIAVTRTEASGTDSVAIGTAAKATHDNSTAVGAGATTESANQMALGTETNTYRMAGLTSADSRAAQSGPLEIATTDANGHLASDGGTVFTTLSQQGAGIAIANALENPDLVGHEQFGLAANFGFFEGSSALGITAMGVLGRNFMGSGERWALSGGVGVSLSEEKYGGRKSDTVVGGRAGLQVTW